MMDRQEYTWDKACKDLALMTHLTVHEAAQLTYVLRARTKLHPYDAVPVLVKLLPFLVSPISPKGMETFTRWLVDLAELYAAQALKDQEVSPR